MTEQVNFHRRRAGLSLPLSALNSDHGLGIGDTAALELFFDWMNDAGLSVIQLLPLNDLGPSDSCPYAAMSALAFDALAYGDPLALPELRGRTALESTLRRAAGLRRARRVGFASARALKREAFLEAFRTFERSGSTQRREAFGYFRGSNDDWLDEYALFRALKEESGWTPWQTWEPEIRDFKPKALAAARARLIDTVRFHEWLQWTMHGQWAGLRRAAERRGVLIFGDLPFGIAKESSDVWARQADFDFSATMGAPPDKYSPAGQDWGLPAYRWEHMEAGGHAWWRRRLRQAGALYDLFRLDHAIGFFRTWQVRGGPDMDRFDPAADTEAEERGRRFFAMAKECGRPAYPVAEDLGVVPEYMPPVLAALDIPGYRIAPWLRNPDGGVQHPASYPALSVATLANHDMPPFARWWGEAPRHERDAYWRMAAGTNAPAPSLREGALRTIIENLYSSGSSLVLLQFQDAFGSRERVNVPGTITPRNWTYRVPFTVEALRRETRPRKIAELLRSLALSSGRL